MGKDEGKMKITGHEQKWINIYSKGVSLAKQRKYSCKIASSLLISYGFPRVIYN